MTTNLHDKMLAAIDALFSASNEIEAHIAEEQLLDVRAEINKYKLAAESLNEGLRLDDWDKIGCVNHDCDKCKALAEQPAPATELREQEPVAWMNPHGGMLTANYIENFASGLDKEIHNIPLYTTPQAQPAREPTIYVDPDAIRILLDPDHSGVVTAQLTRHKPDPLRGPKVGLSITKGNT